MAETQLPTIENSLDMTVRELMSHLQQRLLHKTRYFDVGALQSVTDYWTYQEIISERQPDVLIEIGNFAGGSTLSWAHMFDLLDKGQVIGIDIDHGVIDERVRRHPRISLLEGHACDLFDTVQKMVKDAERVMIIEDSSHCYDNTLAILRTFSPLVTVGDYFVVEDTICHHGLDDGPEAPNAYEAVQDFLQENKAFVADRDRESFIITWNPGGVLKRTA